MSELILPEEPNLSEYGLNPKLPEVFDATMVTDFEACPSLFYLRHILGLRRRGAEESNDLNWGSKWHQLMHLYHRLIAEGVHFVTAGETAIAETLAEWPQDLHPETDIANRGPDRMILVFSKYIKEFGEKDTQDLTRLRQEQYFDLYCPSDADCPFGGCDLRWSGRIDDVVRERGKILVWDYKTSRRMGPRYFDTHRYSYQIPGYVWAAHHLIPDEEIQGARLDVAYTISASEDLFRRTFKYTEEQILEWRYNAKQKVREIRDWFHRAPNSPEAWPKNFSECTKYGNCAYADLHFRPPTGDTRLRILQEDYVEDRWDPALLG